MASKFETFLKDKKIDPRRVLAASHDLERLRPEDRKQKLTERKARKSEDGKKKDGERKKIRSGRPVTDRALAAALAGKAVPGGSKTRLLRAVNHLLEQKKQEKVDLRTLFELPKKADAAA